MSELNFPELGGKTVSLHPLPLAATKRILVTGDRNWTDSTLIGHALFDLQQELALPPEELILIEGMARGADSAAYYQGHMILGWQSERYPAKWERYGRAAGPVRNKEMLDSGIDLCLAFHDALDLSRGTRDMVRRCLARGVEVRHYSHGHAMQLLTHV